MANNYRTPQVASLADDLVSPLKPQTHYQAIPNPEKNIESLYRTVLALKEVVETITRQRGYVDDSFINMVELSQVVHALEVQLAGKADA